MNLEACYFLNPVILIVLKGYVQHFKREKTTTTTITTKQYLTSNFIMNILLKIKSKNKKKYLRALKMCLHYMKEEGFFPKNLGMAFEIKGMAE
jgi:hypothetical protein